jgi:hypothetical protein
MLLALVVVFTACMDEAFAWTLTVGFEAGQPGANASGMDAFWEAGNTTTISNARAHSGSQSARMQWQRGDTGFQNNRGALLFPTDVLVGQELWGRAYWYFQAPWSWQSHTDENCGCATKMFRFHKELADGSQYGTHEGYISIYGTNNDEPRGDCEVCDKSRWNLWQNRNLPPAKLKANRWYALEQYVYLHPTQGIYRMWINGVLKVEDVNINTATSDIVRMDFAYFMSSWNGGVPQDQVQYIDDIILTTDTPVNRDAEGNPMIGPDPSDFVPPTSPKNLRVVSPQ